MATRDNQGLQIALIIFVMLTIVLIVTTYMFFRSFSDQRDKATALEQQNLDKDTKMRSAIAEAADLKSLITAAPNEGVDVLKKTAAEEFQVHGENLTDKNQNYRGLVEQLIAKIRKHEAAITTLTAQAAELNDKIKTNDEAAQKQIASYDQQMAKATDDLKGERQTFNDNRKTLTDQQTQLAAGFEAKQQQRDQAVQEYTGQVSTLTDNLAKTEKLLAALRNKEALESKAIEFPDGKVTHVNQKSRLVWLNVGPAEGLRRQTSFVIVAPEDGNPIKSTPKGMIEVVRLTGAHQAEARIVEDDLSNPIMPGDNIFSVVWQAGRGEHFALAGRMDIDGDGESDRQRIRDLISLNGGIIDAEVTDDGQRSGQMSVDTKYLVLGARPDAEGAADREAYSSLFSEAQALGVETIPLARFVDYMGYKLEDRTVNLGQFARPSDFKPRLPDGVQRVVPGSAPSQDLRKPRGATPAVPY
jgi:hypothetical protein